MMAASTLFLLRFCVKSILVFSMTKFKQKLSHQLSRRAGMFHCLIVTQFIELELYQYITQCKVVVNSQITLPASNPHF